MVVRALSFLVLVFCFFPGKDLLSVDHVVVLFALLLGPDMVWIVLRSLPPPAGIFVLLSAVFLVGGISFLASLKSSQVPFRVLVVLHCSMPLCGVPYTPRASSTSIAPGLQRKQ